MAAEGAQRYAMLVPAGTPDYSRLSFAELKQAMSSAYGRLTEIERLHGASAGAQNMFVTIQDVTRGAQVFADQGWQGTAAEAAAAAVLRNVGYYGESHNAAQSTANATRHLAEATRYHHDQVSNLKQVDSRYPAALAASGHNPFAAAQEHQQRIQHNQQAHASAVEQATALDEKGREYSAQMRAASWPPVRSDDKNAPPPRTLPEPQPVSPPPGPWPPGPPPPVRQPRHHHPRTNPIAPVTGPGRHPSGPPVDPGTTKTAGVLLPPVAASGSTGAGGYGPAQSPGVPGLGAGAAAGGGALAAGGLAGGLSGRLAGSGAGEPGTGEPNTSRAASGPGEGEPDPARAVASESAGRGSGAVVEDEPGARGMYPGGGGGARKGGEDEERKVPDYLEELGDVWGAEGQFSVPPVLGEDGD